ncbi:hydroxymethylpyrimidine/phosphomethylpyrimidine kinase [bacterium A37T11]|nr:hydroxymethylpyrimidine/phosphomethylpyrimidine kinase [bacterium A37T11]
MNKLYKYPCVLSIAGFDGSGGAGIQGDQKTITSLGCYATNVLTALPIQNTTGVKRIHSIPAEIVNLQLETIMDDILPDVIKIGMIHQPEIVRVIGKVLRNYPDIPVIFDPVLVATSGHLLADHATVNEMITELFPLATLITPNMEEAAFLSGIPVHTVEDMDRAAEKLKSMGCSALLLKGGHLSSAQLTSLLVEADGTRHRYISEKINSDNLHGTGCTLSSAIASFMALEKPLTVAVALAQDYVYQAIDHGKDVFIGRGNGSLNHFFDPKKLVKVRQ